MMISRRFRSFRFTASRRFTEKRGEIVAGSPGFEGLKKRLIDQRSKINSLTSLAAMATNVVSFVPSSQ